MFSSRLWEHATAFSLAGHAHAADSRFDMHVSLTAIREETVRSHQYFFGLDVDELAVKMKFKNQGMVSRAGKRVF